MMRFSDPWWLVLAPAVVALIWFRSRRRARPAVVFSSLDALRALPRTAAQRLKGLLPYVEGAGLLCLVVALARPQVGREDVSLSTQGIAIEMIIDRSGSMSSLDLDDDRWDRKDVRRIDVVKAVVRDFVDTEGELPGRPQDLIGLVTFAGYVQSHCPLTLDHEAFLKVLDTVDLPPGNLRDPNDQEVFATALGDGLVTGVDRLKPIEARSKVAILLSDGRGNIGVASPEAAAEAAKAAGVKVYTVAIGQRGPDLDEDALRKIAETTGGQAFYARTGGQLRQIYAEIDTLERSALTSFRATRWKDRFDGVLLAGLALVALHRLLGDTRFRSLP